MQGKGILAFPGSLGTQEAGANQVAESQSTASFQKFNLDKWAEPLEDLNFQMAFRSEHKKWFWDVRP